MTDVLVQGMLIALNGFSTGVGVICAHEVWDWMKRRRIHKIPFNLAKDLFNKDEGTRRRR